MRRRTPVHAGGSVKKAQGLLGVIQEGPPVLERLVAAVDLSPSSLKWMHC